MRVAVAKAVYGLIVWHNYVLCGQIEEFEVLKSFNTPYHVQPYLSLKIDFSCTINDKVDVTARIMDVENLFTIGKQLHFHIANQLIDLCLGYAMK